MSTTTQGTPIYLWLDLETTGLNPKKDSILEVACVATDERLNLVSAPCSWVVWYGQPSMLVMDDYVRNMHTKNGLLDAIPDAMFQVPQIEEALLGFVREIFIPLAHPNGGKPILAGSSIHFDRSFIREHMPRLDAVLHHRHFDVSVLKMACKTIYGFECPKAEAHRAMPDIEESLAHARACFGWMYHHGENSFVRDE